MVAARVGPVDPATPGGPATPGDPVDLAARGRVDPAGRVTVVDPGDMNRVVAATAGTAAVMAPADLASRAVPVVRVVMIPAVPVGPVGMTLEDPVGPVGMTLEDPVGPVGMILGDPEGRLRAQNPVVRVDPERLVPSPVARVEPGNREATDLSLGRVLLGRMPMRRVRMRMGRHPTAAGPVRTPVLLHLTAADRRTPVDRRRDQTTRAAVTCPEATRAAVTRVAATRVAATRAAATLRAEATRKAELNHICPSRLDRCG
jgi:hypothetical protein